MRKNAHVAVYVAGLSTMVKPGRRLKVVKDEPDNRIIECADAGLANAIVTGDKALLALKAYKGTRVISLNSYLEDHG